VTKRDETIHEIKTALERRSGKKWSVTGGRGTAWGWITIDAPPKRRTGTYKGEGTCITAPDRVELAMLLGLETIHFQGESIPASYDYYDEYTARARGETPTVEGEPYWD